MTSENELFGKPPGGPAQPEKPKIIVPGGGAPEEAGASEKHADEGWKEKARREKEKLAEAAAQGAAEARELPAASFLGLLEDLAVRVMFALGQLREPGSQEVYLDLEGAKYHIDLLGILEAKTKGNLDATEAATLKELLTNLRAAFVQISRSVGAAVIAAQAKAGGTPGAAGGPEPKGPPGGGKAGGPGGDKPPPKIII